MTEIEMVEIPGGTFLMGSRVGEGWDCDDERPQHEVTVPAFLMGRYPVTQYQYKKVMGNNPSHFKGVNSHFKGANRPVESVSWNDAVEFCEKLSQQSGKDYRLPSESEWEYACRAGTTTPFFFGESLAKHQANFDSDSTTDVGSFPANDFGLYDMHGNVWEWCLDTWHGNYQGAPTDGTAWATEGNSKLAMLRGGSWNSNPGYCRSACRDRWSPGIRGSDGGFRVVCEIEEPNRLTKDGDVTELDEMIATVTAYLEDITGKYNAASNRISQLNREIDRYKAAKNTMQTALNSMILAKQQLELEDIATTLFESIFQPDSEGNHG
jgi:formylglycine-generating enzyme required for sulfatase activity